MSHSIPDKPWSKGDIVRGADGAGLGSRPFVMENEPALIKGFFRNSYFAHDEKRSTWVFGENVDANRYVLATEADGQFYLRIAQEDFDRAEKELTYATNILTQIRLAESHGRHDTLSSSSISP